MVRTPSYMHTISHHHPIVAFEDVRVPASHLVGTEGGGMTFAHEWFRYERLMIGARCCGAMERLIEGRTAFMIAHRLSTLDNCDVRLRLERGLLVEASERSMGVAQ